MAMDYFLPILIIGLMYSWRVLVGILCFAIAEHSKAKAALMGTGIGAGCLIAAVVISLFIVLAVESWIVPISNSRECISGAADCPIWLLQIGELVSDWQFVALEGAAILAAVWLSLRRLQPFNQ
ncbi:hypothetical protein [Marinobacter nauticus]